MTNIPTRDDFLEQIILDRMKKAAENDKFYVVFKQPLPGDLLEKFRAKSYYAKNGKFIEHKDGSVDETYNFNDFIPEWQFRCLIRFDGVAKMD